MRRLIAPALIAAVSTLGAAPRTSVRPEESSPPDLTIIATSDVHGNFFPYNYVTSKRWAGSLARVATYVDSVRDAMGADRVVLLDNGDILQGQPTVYFSNYIDTASTHIAAKVYKRLGYDAATIGNHDIETGHDAYDRWIGDCRPIPVLGANVIDESTGEPYLQPYSIIERGGRRVAVLGLLTPAIPAWLPRGLWEGLRFDDMEAAARLWIDRIRREHNPDLIVGLFHSGGDSSRNAFGFNENAAIDVARNVAGFDAVVFGHDHRLFCDTITNVEGKRVVAVNPANNARAVARIDVTFGREQGEPPVVAGSLVNVATINSNRRFTLHFAPEVKQVKQFVGEVIGEADGLFSSHDAFFGPSAFIDLIHNLQLSITGADISFAAPLSVEAEIKKGPITVADMFTLYKYENMLCTMELTGREIRNYLERSYDNWVHVMETAESPMLKLTSDAGAASDDGSGRYAFLNPVYNFDSAAGIDYDVDLRESFGRRITIKGFSGSDRPFSPDSIYTVAVNSYRANGGGDLLTLGAGLGREELPRRIVASTDRDLRYYMIEQVKRLHHLSPAPNDNWRFIPADFVEAAARRERAVIFGK